MVPLMQGNCKTSSRKDQLGSGQSSITYVKPYTNKVDIMKMSMNYEPTKFQEFDGKGNPRQLIAHFVKTCSDIGTYDDLLVKQFVQSLKVMLLTSILICYLTLLIARSKWSVNA